MLEQEHFRNRPADFVYMLILGMAMLLVRRTAPARGMRETLPRKLTCHALSCLPQCWAP